MDGQASGRIPGVLLGAAAFVIVVAGLRAASDIIVVLLLAIFIAIAVTPLYFRLIRWRVPSWAALVLLILGLAVLISAGAVVLGRSLNDMSNSLPAYQDRLQSEITRWAAWLQSKGLEEPGAALRETLDARLAMRFVGNTVTALSLLLSRAVLILFVVIFLLIEAAILPAKIRAIPGMTDENWTRLHSIMDTFRRYMGIKTLISLLTGVLVTGLLALLGINYALVLGVVAFLLNYVPNVGSILAGIPAVMLALLQHGGSRALAVMIGYLVINLAIGNLIEPRVMGRGLGLSPVVIVVSLIFWGWVLGPVGMLLSVPLTMTVKIALESVEGMRGMAILMGSGPPQTPPK